MWFDRFALSLEKNVWVFFKRGSQKRNSFGCCMDDFQKQALTEHLTELRKCLIHSVLATVAGFALCYSYSKELGQLLFKPLYAAMPEGSSLIFTSYQEGFFFI